MYQQGIQIILCSSFFCSYRHILAAIAVSRDIFIESNLFVLQIIEFFVTPVVLKNRRVSSLHLGVN